MSSSVSSISGTNVFLYLIPILSVYSQSIQEKLMLIYCPSSRIKFTRRCHFFFLTYIFDRNLRLICLFVQIYACFFVAILRCKKLVCCILFNDLPLKFILKNIVIESEFFTHFKIGILLIVLLLFNGNRFKLVTKQIILAILFFKIHNLLFALLLRRWLCVFHLEFCNQ